MLLSIDKTSQWVRGKVSVASLLLCVCVCVYPNGYTNACIYTSSLLVSCDQTCEWVHSWSGPPLRIWHRVWRLSCCVEVNGECRWHIVIPILEWRHSKFHAILLCSLSCLQCFYSCHPLLYILHVSNWSCSDLYIRTIIHTRKDCSKVD